MRLRLSFLWVLLFVSSCAVRRPAEVKSSESRFADVYRSLSIPSAAASAHDSSGARVTISAKDMPVPDFLRVISAKYGASVVYEDALDSRVISIELNDVALPDVFGLLARRLKVQTSRVGSAWFVGNLRQEDRAFLVRKVRRLSDVGLKESVQTFLSEFGHVVAFSDGLVVVADRVEVLEHISGMLDQIEAARTDTWVVQLYLVSGSEDLKQTLGVDASALGNLSYSFAKASATGGLAVAGSFAAALKATASADGTALVGKPVFLLGDGETSAFVSGASIPIPRKTVSDQGTVTTQGFDYVQSGLSASCSVRESQGDGAKLTVKVSIGDIVGFVETAPIQSKSEFSTVAVVQSGGVYLLGSLDTSEALRNDSGIFARALTLKTREKKSGSVQVWAKIFRVAGPTEQAAVASVRSLPSPESSAKGEIVDVP